MSTWHARQPRVPSLPIFFTVAPRSRPPARIPAFERARAPFDRRPARRWFSRRSDVKGRGGFSSSDSGGKTRKTLYWSIPLKTLYLVTPGRRWSQLATLRRRTMPGKQQQQQDEQDLQQLKQLIPGLGSGTNVSQVRRSH